MKLNYAPRQSGKTTQMIERLARDTRYILLTFSIEEADRLGRQYNKFIDPRRIMYWRDYVHSKRGRGHGQKVLVDNADMVLEDAIGDSIEEASMTSPRTPFEIIGKFD